MKQNTLLKALPVIALLLVFTTLVFFSGKENFPLYHEGERTFNGYSYLKYGNSINHASYPILTHAIAAVPLLFIDVDYPENFTYTNPKVFGQEFFFYYGDNNAKELVFWARIPFILLGILLGIFVFVWAREIFNYKAGLFALTLFSFSPLMIGYTPIVSADMALATYIFITTYFFWKFYKEPRPLFLVLCGIFFGLTILTKLPGIFLLPLFFIIGAIGILTKRPLKKQGSFRTLFLTLFLITMIGGIVFVTVNLNEIHPIYYSEDPLYINSDARSEERLEILIDSIGIENDLMKNSVRFFVTKVPVPAPHFFESLYSVYSFVNTGDDTNFFGHHYTSEAKGVFYFLIFFLKTPLSMLLLLVLAVFFARKYYIHDGLRFDVFFLILPLFLYPLQFLLTKVYGGILYLLPLYPFLFVLLGNVINYTQMKRKWFKWSVILLTATYIVVSLLSFPFYLSFFNSIAGGTENGYNVSLLDFDYYQDLYRFEQYLNENNISEIKVNFAYYSSTLKYQDYNYRFINGSEPQTGFIGVNAGALIGVKERNANDFAWLRQLTPTARVGTFFIYNVTEEDLVNIQDMEN